MFRSHLTRPLRWSIPLAVLGAIVAAVWFLRPLEIEIAGEPIRCSELVGAGDIDVCGAERRERLLVTALILVVGGLPLALVVLRGLIVAADTLVALQQDVRRLHERLDREREG
ncbi:MAG TPA: hypothetical protein VGX25_01740 [Actinophytocola sp.]|uniref:hypothetical protein n=1 Tax=Actinophytocola sp. TaxID=1872138 RepID=UPI002DDCE3D2|nr:hypothetical protein [Actinophytocola sp.]HEV2778099.1 hypothetical protein [Actinophytocola sp.]